MRKIEEIIEEYKTLRSAKLRFVDIMRDQKYAETQTPEFVNTECKETIDMIESCKDSTRAYLMDLVKTHKGMSILRFHFKKWKSENNLWANKLDNGTLGAVLASAEVAQNYLKLEAALTSIIKAKGDLGKAKSMTNAAYAKMPSVTPDADPFIFASAAKIAQVDKSKSDTSKGK